MRFIHYRRSGSPKTSVIVESFRAEVVYRYHWIVQKFETTPFQPKRKRHIVVDLRARSEQTFVESKRAKSAYTIAHIGSLQNVDVPRRADASMMVPDVSTEPLDLAHDRAIAVDISIAQVIATSDAGQCCVREKMLLYALQPLRMRHCIIVRYSDNVTVDAIKACIECGNLALCRDGDDLQRQTKRASLQNVLRFNVGLAHNDEHLIRSACLLLKPVKALDQVCGPPICRHKN